MSNASDYVGGPPPLWVTGTTYSQGKLVYSPADFQTYIRKVAGAGSTDPSSDTTNWQPTGNSAFKSVQRGVMTSGGGTVNTTITAVVMAKTEVRYLGANVNMQYPQYLQLTSATNIAAIASSGGGTTGTLSWELTERY